MTIEEAIKSFKQLKLYANECVTNFEKTFPGWESNHRKNVESYDMAITALRAQAEIVHCRDCKHLYFKDFEAFCPHRVGPRKPSGFCDYGVRKDEID